MSDDQPTLSRRSFLQQAGLAAAVPSGLTSVIDRDDESGSGTRTLQVGPSGDIQRAVNRAAPGDTVVVNGGTHSGRVVIDKPLTLRGTDDATIVPSADLRTGGSGFGTLVRVTDVQAGVTVQGFSIDGDDDGVTTAAVGVHFDEAGGELRDLTLRGTEVGVVATGTGSRRTVTVRNSRFESLGSLPLVFYDEGVHGKLVDSALAGTPGTTQVGVTIAFGATADLRGNGFEEFYDEETFGLGVGVFAPSTATVRENTFGNVQYPAYFLSAPLAPDGERDRSRFVGNEVDGRDIPAEGSTSGTTVQIVDLPEVDGPAGPVDEVAVVGNHYANIDVGITALAGGRHLSDTMVSKNRFTDVPVPTTTSGTPLPVQPTRLRFSER